MSEDIPSKVDKGIIAVGGVLRFNLTDDLHSEHNFT